MTTQRTSTFFGNTIVTNGGITVDGINVLDAHTPWVDWVPTVVSGQADPLISTSGTKYKRIGDMVTVLFNVSFIYNPGGPSGPAIVFDGLPVPASKSAEYWNGCVISFQDVGSPDANTFGRLEIDPGLSQTQITTRSPVGYLASPLTTVISGQITYKVDE